MMIRAVLVHSKTKKAVPLWRHGEEVEVALEVFGSEK
jgi:hypothetical protein